MYTLAHDENGVPLDVPAAAVGWLVRRHGGGKGRPGAIYDGDGCPLVVELGATARDLAARGCGPGPYRLEAVDSNRRPLGVIAHTEIAGDADAETPPRKAGDPIEALARAVESMQRVQAERERHQIERDRIQADLLARLVDRIGPPAPKAQPDMRAVIEQYNDIHKILRKTAREEQSVAASEAAPRNGIAAEPEAPATPQNDTLAKLEKVFGIAMVAAPVVGPLAFKAVGFTDEKITEYTQKILDVSGSAVQALQMFQGVPGMTATTEPSADESPAGEVEAKPEPTPTPKGLDEADKKIRAAMKLLTREEADRVRALVRAYPAAHEIIRTRITNLSAEQAAAQARALLATMPAGPTAPAAATDNDAGDPETIGGAAHGVAAS